MFSKKCFCKENIIQNRQASFGRSECKWVYVKCNPLVSIQSSNHVNIIPDSMAQWQDCRSECWEAWGPEFNPRPGRVGVRFLYKLGQPPKIFISYSLLYVAQIGRDYFEELHIHFVSSFMLSVSSAYTKV